MSLANEHEKELVKRRVIVLTKDQQHTTPLLQALSAKGVPAHVVQQTTAAVVMLNEYKPDAMIVCDAQPIPALSELLDVIAKYFPSVACWKFGFEKGQVKLSKFADELRLKKSPPPQASPPEISLPKISVVEKQKTAPHGNEPEVYVEATESDFFPELPKINLPRIVTESDLKAPQEIRKASGVRKEMWNFPPLKKEECTPIASRLPLSHKLSIEEPLLTREELDLLLGPP